MVDKKLSKNNKKYLLNEKLILHLLLKDNIDKTLNS